MPSINLKQFSNTPQLKAWLKAGEIVELRDRDEVIAEITPKRSINSKPDWKALFERRRALFGEQILPGADLLIEERESYKY